MILATLSSYDALRGAVTALGGTPATTSVVYTTAVVAATVNGIVLKTTAPATLSDIAADFPKSLQVATVEATA